MRSISRIWKDFQGPKKIRVAFIGAQNCGKTVCLTSVASHLQFGSNEKLMLKDGWIFSKRTKSSGCGARRGRSKIKSFEYEKYIKMIESGEWPGKTTDECSVFRIPIELKDKNEKERYIDLEILDMAGERTADFPMAGQSYVEWCRWMNERYKGNEAYAHYLEKAESADDECGVIEAYKDFLLSEYKKGVPSLTPSICKLWRKEDDADENVSSVAKYKQSGEENIKKGFVGLDGNSQFVPMPEKYFAKAKRGEVDVGYKLAKTFKKNYAKYRNKVVMPIVDWVENADCMFYFVDVLNLLRRGEAIYGQEKALSENVLSVFAKKGFLKKLAKIMCLRFRTRLSRAYIVVPKIDMVFLGEEESCENMTRLAWKMLGDSLSCLGLRKGRIGVIPCAAVNAGGENSVREAVKEGKEEGSYVPGEWIWPDEGKGYKFAQRFRPVNQKAPPSQIGVDRIIEKIFGL